MKPTVKLVASGPGFSPVRKSLECLKKEEVLVGIPESKAPRRAGDVNNAQLMYIHTNGSPLKGIPARPVIEPAIKARGNKQAIEAELKASALAALDGKPAVTFLRRAGLTAQNAAKAWFTDPRNGWAPNAPSTIRAKGSNRPLIDTAQMRNAITYVVKSK